MKLNQSSQTDTTGLWAPTTFTVRSRAALIPAALHGELKALAGISLRRINQCSVVARAGLMSRVTDLQLVNLTPSAQPELYSAMAWQYQRWRASVDNCSLIPKALETQQRW